MDLEDSRNTPTDADRFADQMENARKAIRRGIASMCNQTRGMMGNLFVPAFATSFFLDMYRYFDGSSPFSNVPICTAAIVFLGIGSWSMKTKSEVEAWKTLRDFAKTNPTNMRLLLNAERERRISSNGRVSEAVAQALRRLEEELLPAATGDNKKSSDASRH